EVPRLKYEHLTDKRRGEPSEEIRKRVDKVREIQKCRYKNDGIIFNAHLESKELERYCVLDKEAGVTFWAYCLMKNHVHLIAVPKAKDSLANGIGETHRRYTRMVNFREDWRGFLWQGRFMSYPLDENYLYTAIRYVERNPVRAGLVKRAEDYQWSSAKDHVYGKSNILLSDFFMLSEIKDWRYYLAKENKDSDNKYLHI
ncbi:MAG: transposase, partial [Candidatus Omnitrophota bacterium]|nr:transposase [Candidatus Omnitrophota bacterium]